jgi:hypothetical protein
MAGLVRRRQCPLLFAWCICTQVPLQNGPWHVGQWTTPLPQYGAVLPFRWLQALAIWHRGLLLFCHMMLQNAYRDACLYVALLTYVLHLRIITPRHVFYTTCWGAGH